MVEQIKVRELDDLYLLGAKGRKRLHDLLDEGQTKMIETIALVDRTFQQRCLLEGGSTANLGIFSKLIVEVDKELFQPSLPIPNSALTPPHGQPRLPSLRPTEEKAAPEEERTTEDV